ncbi:MAG: hypothetical protein IT459_15630 [Planctomycetes bacterium]|nr:hypothetical protein [Planctomycetota bacterium]
MSLRLHVENARTLLALGLAAASLGCSAGVQGAEPVQRPPSSAPADAPAPSGSDFEARWSYLAAHTAPDHTHPQWNGAIDGPVTLWHPDGTKRGEGRYEHSTRVGPWVFWHENGQLRWQGTYVEGELDGRELAWFENGQLQLECTWKDGKREGVFAQWHENGRLAAQGEYRRGRREGRFHYYRADGTVDEALTGTYVADVRVAD